MAEFNWAELQRDLVALICRRLNLIEDYLNFGTVCKSWHSAATKNNFNSDLPRVPWLMLAEEDGDECRKFFSLYNGMILKKRIPKAKGKRCMESMGWLITVGEEKGEASLLHPFSVVQIDLPHQNTTEEYEGHETGERMAFFQRAVLSASPSHTSDYVLVVVDGGMKHLSFWRPGDLRWTRTSRDNHSPYADVTYFNGHFYAVDFMGQILVFDLPVNHQPTTIAQLPVTSADHTCDVYLLESLGSLFVVLRYGVLLRYVNDDDDSERIPPLTFVPELGYDDTNLTYGTRHFLVFHVDLADGKVAEIKELGDRAFFLGANASLSIQASQFPNIIKPNHIYFTEDQFETYLCYKEGGGWDMGVFNLANGNIQPHYEGLSLSRVCPPIWITLTLY